MLDAVAVATWIALCIPMADPLIVGALVHAGSEGDPLLVTDASGKAFSGKSLAEAVAHAESLEAAGAKEIYLGLAQVPLSALKPIGLNADDGLDKCGSLEIGYESFIAAFNYARTIEKTPAKTLAAAFAFYRTRTIAVDLPYAKKATEFVLAKKMPGPAPLKNRQRQEMFAEWAAGFAQRLAHRAMVSHESAADRRAEAAVERKSTEAAAERKPAEAAR